MTESTILYFEKGGPEHTETTLAVAAKRARVLQPAAVVIATTTGRTALLAAPVFAETGSRLIAVTFQRHLWSRYAPPNQALVAQCREMGVVFLPDEPVVPWLRDERPDIADAWFTVSQGFKVALQVASMCVDAGLLRDGAQVIAIGGTGSGADTAIVAETHGFAHLLRSNVSEIICMPQQ